MNKNRTNTDNRSTDSTVMAFDRDGNDIVGVDYCYKVRAQEVYQDNGGVYELTLKLETRTLVNAMILFQDEATTSNFKENLLWNYRIFVGDSPNY